MSKTGDSTSTASNDVIRESKKNLGIRRARYLSLSSGSSQLVEGEVVDEVLACISVNGEELATFMCSPHQLDRLATGFLYNEALIHDLDDVRSVHISKNQTCVEIWLVDSDLDLPDRPIVTAGCGGGVTFDDLSVLHEPLSSTLTATPGELSELMKRMHLGADLYQRARGIHTAAVADHEQILLQVEDVGRHNCLDGSPVKRLRTESIRPTKYYLAAAGLAVR
jgi:FdhD protein